MAESLSAKNPRRARKRVPSLCKASWHQAQCRNGICQITHQVPKNFNTRGNQGDVPQSLSFLNRGSPLVTSPGARPSPRNRNHEQEARATEVMPADGPDSVAPVALLSCFLFPFSYSLANVSSLSQFSDSPYMNSTQIQDQQTLL